MAPKRDPKPFGSARSPKASGAKSKPQPKASATRQRAIPDAVANRMARARIAAAGG